MSKIFQATAVNEISGIVEQTRGYHGSHVTLTAQYRREQLQAMYRMVKENEEELKGAVQKDLGISKNAVFVGSIGLLYNDLTLALSQLDAWMAPEFPSVDLAFKMDKAQIRNDPKGVVLIIGAWNYPVQLVLLPLVGAIAAGCCAIIKPSELSENTAMLLAQLIPEYLDEKAYCVVNGAIPETTALLAEKFDHILYTGNGQVARIVAAAAARHLTPLTLELGGKSPAIVDKDVNLEIVARRIVWAAFHNCGQTCIRPDYVMVAADQRDALVEELKKALVEFHGQDMTESDSLGRVINDRHFQRVTKLIDASGGTMVHGGKRDGATRFIEPVVMIDVQPDDSLMAGEIFGPVLPIMVREDWQDMLNYINAHDKPLALYAFTNNADRQKTVLTETSSGSCLVNDTFMQAVVHQLPFGGIGESGQGAYHGKFSFDMFTHKKAVLVKQLNMEFVNDLRYPPLTDKKVGWLRMLSVSEPRKKFLGLF